MEQLSTDEKNILKLLRYGADTARTTAYLAGITGLDTRTVRNIIRRLVIDHGVPVVGERTGSYRGYYIATDQDELARASGPLKNEIKQLARRNRALIFAQIRTDWLEYLTTKGDQDNDKPDI